MELGHWVTGSTVHLGHLSRPDHRVIILTRCQSRVFPVFEKMPKMQNVHLKCWNDKSYCQVSVVGLKSLDVSPCNELLLLPMIIKNSLACEYFFLTSMTSLLDIYVCAKFKRFSSFVISHTPTHKSTFGVHYRTGSPGQLGLRVAGFPGHWVAWSQNVTQFNVWSKYVTTSSVFTADELNWTELTCTKLTQLHDSLLVTRVGVTQLIGCRAAVRALQFANGNSVQLSWVRFVCCEHGFRQQQSYIRTSSRFATIPKVKWRHVIHGDDTIAFFVGISK